MSGTIYNGMLLSIGPGNAGSDITTYNITTGKIMWVYTPKQEGFESPYGTYPISLACIVDGKIYTSSSEHSPTQPLERGWKLYVINATTGEEIWGLDGALDIGGISNGYVMAQSRYDGYQYSFGKGQSATTVTAPLTAVPLGSSVLVTGTVLDQSPAQPDTPCVSAASMGTWMDYLHMQLPVSYTHLTLPTILLV